MTQEQSASVVGDASVGARRSVRERVRAYKDLAKFVEFGAFLIVPTAWSLLPYDATSGRTVVILVLMLVAAVGIRTAESALDDIAGIRDEIDVVNYADAGTLRARKRKPILDGRLTERDALRYTWSVLALAATATTVAADVADFKPLWAPALVAAAAFVVVGYSWGPKLSYIPGGQEFVVTFGMTAMLCSVYALASGHLATVVVLEGLLLGVWLMQPVTFANVHDVDGDRRAGRHTMAVRLSPAAHRRYTSTLLLAGWVLLAVVISAGELPWWTALVLAPCIALQAVALAVSVRRRDPLLARRTCHRAYRIGWLGLVVTNLIALH